MMDYDETPIEMDDERFARDDGGRSESRRPKQRNDCAVRAYAIATGRPYDEVYDRFSLGGRRASEGTDKAFTAALFRLECWDELTFPAVKGRRRMNPPSFVASYPEGRWIVSTAKHLTAVVDGVWRDEFAPDQDRCIYRAWRMPDDWRPAS